MDQQNPIYNKGINQPNNFQNNQAPINNRLYFNNVQEENEQR